MNFPFDHSLMVYFRKRFEMISINSINDLICLEKQEDESDDDDVPPPPSSNDQAPKGETKKENKGKLILDATCAPTDIRYPTDIALLNEAREKLEKIIDTLHKPLQGTDKKPRTYRFNARKAYLKIAKQRKPKKKQIRKAIKQQLNYVGRDLIYVEIMMEKSPAVLTEHQLKQLAVIRELFRQQQHMYNEKTHQVENRIVSISQPHVRPIVRGKANASTEFGAKVAISLVNGDAFIERLDWNNFNEGGTLIGSAEAYKRRYGYYPEAILADTIYHNRENLAYCKAHNNRLSGPRLGRPPISKDNTKLKLERQDAKIRNAVEGKLGEGKRRYGLGLIMARLQETSETVIALQFLVMNLERRLRILFYLFFKELFSRKIWRSTLITV